MQNIYFIELTPDLKKRRTLRSILFFEKQVVLAKYKMPKNDPNVTCQTI
jgi:hypothetical protein